MSAVESAAAVRRGAGLFRLEDRGLIEVRGGDRIRWLDGMVSNDVAGLREGPERSGCYAALLSRTGRIVADLQVLLRPDALWLELPRASVEAVIGVLCKFIIADDVQLEDRSAAWKRLALEGPAAPRILEAAGGALQLAPDACAERRVAGADVLVAAFGWSGEAAFQLFTPPASAEAVGAALRRAGEASGMVEPGAEVLEILRIEAGRPLLGAELDESVLPPEAGLDRAISTTKGCYTGQEVIARIASQGRVKHRLVGLTSQGDSRLPVGAEVHAGDRRIGEVTSSCVAPAGPIALAFVSCPHDEPDTELSVGGRSVTVTALPFAGPDSRP